MPGNGLAPPTLRPVSLFAAQSFVYWILSLGALVLAGYALVDALRHPASAYTAAGKLSKKAWVAILGVATLLTFVGLGGIGFLVILSIVAAGVYLADVRPALRSTGGGRRGPRGGGYTGW